MPRSALLTVVPSVLMLSPERSAVQKFVDLLRRDQHVRARRLLALDPFGEELPTIPPLCRT